MTIRIMFSPEMTKPDGKSYEVAVVSVSPSVHPEFDQISEAIIEDLPSVLGKFLQEAVNSPHSSLWVKVD